MTIRLKYHQSVLEAELEFPIPPLTIMPQQVVSSKSENDIVKAALAEPLGSANLHRLLRRGERTTLVVPDNTRDCALKKCLPLVIEEVQREIRNNKDITMLIASGTHLPLTTLEKNELLGEDICRRYRVVAHDCHNQRDMVHLGETRYQTTLSISKYVVKAERLIVISAVRPHYFAGYGGGLKLINPGCASYDTILQNHRLMIDPYVPRIQSTCRPGNIRDNPVYEDILDSMKFVPIDFSLQLILNEQGQIIDAFCGELKSAHEKACERASQLFMVPISERADLVITSSGGFPHDINLIQAHKTIEHSNYAVKKNGVVIVSSACCEGIGSPTFDAYFQYDSLKQMHQAILADFQINSNTALSLKQKTEEIKIILISALDDHTVSRYGMISAHSIEDAYAIAKQMLPEKFKTIISPYGACTVPVNSRDQQ